MFNAFFTTKPAGEGSGLGLSISHDIFVKQHAGSIEVDTEPGEFTEFKIILPRVAMPAAKKLQCDGKPFGCRWAGNQLATATVDFTLFVHQQLPRLDT